jgi:hypothetical protein
MVLDLCVCLIVDMIVLLQSSIIFFKSSISSLIRTMDQWNYEFMYVQGNPIYDLAQFAAQETRDLYLLFHNFELKVYS